MSNSDMIDPYNVDVYVVDLRSWLEKQNPILKSLETNEFLLRFLRISKFNLENAKRLLINFWRYRTENPQWFKDRDPKSPVMAEIAETAYAVQLPHSTVDNCLIFIMRIGHYNSEKHTFDQVTKYALGVTDVLNKQPEAQLYGFVIILDFTDFRMHHITIFTPDVARRYVECWQNLYPVRLRQVHFYNYPAIFDPIFYLFRPILKTKICEQIHFHSGSNASNTLHKYVPPDLLPTEFGGVLGTIEDINKPFIQWIKENSAYINSLDQYGIDLSSLNKLMQDSKLDDCESYVETDI